MSGLLFLTAEDFHLKTDGENTILEHEVNGFTLVLFYSTHCTHCNKLVPIFKQLPGTITGCLFGMINVNKNLSVIKKSENTITPLTYVPYIILYYNGRPYMRYDGPSSIKEINTFVINVTDSIKRQIDLDKDNTDDNKHYCIPEYCIARPTKGGLTEDTCYYNFTEAY